ncbi:hypothetical protein [Pedobacter gandavensis]|uniref:hypothetical protein n=1 Tax=Pedobacter gandavensis TaxID=2679963 RepID=UPI0029311352|nr:hypothetical protein [Pedobacter gandavensis]
MKTVKFNLGLVVLLLGFGLVVMQSAFTAPKETTKQNVTGFLFQYKLDSYTLPEIQDIANYERSDESCPTGEHVCGVYLETDQPLNTQPDTDEFDAAKGQLWNSEVSKTPQNSTIIMRN